MPVRGYSLVNGADLQLRRMSVEIRMSRSGIFYSRFGKILDVLSEARADWFFTGDMKNGLVGNFVCISSGMDVSISDNRLVVALTQKPNLAAYDQEEVNLLATDCEFLSDLYANNMQPKERTRIGFRQFFEVDFDSEAECNNWVLSLGLATPSDSITNSFGGRVEGIAYSMLVDCETYKTRISVESAKKEALIDRGDKVATVHAHMLSTKQDEALVRAEKKNAWIKRKRAAGATVDFDSFVESPTNDVLIGEFIKTHFRTAYANFVESAKKVK